MTDTVLSPARAERAVNPWVVAAVVVVPTFMEVLDTTITVVALRYIAGGLSATVDDGEWVITSYLAANAIILPITGWLSAHLGRRNYFLLSIGIFTLASGLCGMATSLGQLIAFRVLQGLAGGGLQPSSQGVLLDAFPVEKQGIAMTLFGLAALLAPVAGDGVCPGAEDSVTSPSQLCPGADGGAMSGDNTNSGTPPDPSASTIARRRTSWIRP